MYHTFMLYLLTSMTPGSEVVPIDSKITIQLGVIKEWCLDVPVSVYGFALFPLFLAGLASNIDEDKQFFARRIAEMEPYSAGRVFRMAHHLLVDEMYPAQWNAVDRADTERVMRLDWPAWMWMHHYRFILLDL
jgi:hypothetical protein